MAAPAVPESGDALAHQSRIVENVIDKHTTNLIRIFGSEMTYFSGRFIELGFITRDASKHIHGVGSGERGSHLLDLLVTNCRISPDKKQWFDKFVSVFSSEAAYKHIANSMTEDLEKMLRDDNTLSSSHHRKRKKTEFNEANSSSSMETSSSLSSSPSSSDSEEQYHKKRRKKKKHSRPSGSKYRSRSSKRLKRSRSRDSDSSASTSEPCKRKKTNYSKSHRKKEKSSRESDKKLRKVF